ncbi:aspartate aminotransferase family protein [Shewanella sp. MBTL60-007]|uniref:aspartate aminotransferase family protein n=1 Tax=Shewanella sp. MBTL60-007 TaxID=2815911 RepID=UPI001BC3926E|nr:aspartate aminotransferase family protein [Shewanella sp. MBTL60-007]GIU13363.1 aspartate aminotransferase family protein [Shewanella sp. MBTL60-007]
MMSAFKQENDENNSPSETGADRSALLYQKALSLMPGGCSRNTVLRRPNPLYAQSAAGCFVTDIEGTRRVDFANNMAALIHGHAHPEIVTQVTEQLQKGSAFTLATEAEIDYAEHLCSRNTGFDKIRFVNSGTEAVMSCLKASRAYTGRAKIAKVEGAYHGLYDYAEVSQTASPSNWGEVSKPNSVPVAFGTPQAALDDVVVIPFNDPPRAIAILNKHKDELACVLVDLLPHRVGLIPASTEFVIALREWTENNGALLVFDEVITFRNGYGGAQDNYPVTPDLTAMGKMIGGGFPVGALAGNSEVMDVMNPLNDKVLFPHSGTFSANPVTMVAGLSAMKLFDREAVFRLNAQGDRLRAKISDVIAQADVPACVTGTGSMFRIHMKATPPTNYRDAYASPQEAKLMTALVDHLFDNGFMMINTCSGTLSTVMTDRELSHFAEVLLAGLNRLKPQFDALKPSTTITE